MDDKFNHPRNLNPILGVNNMAIKIRKASTYLTDGAAIKILLYASAGTGKTWMAAQAPNPVIVLTEKNGLTSVAHSNPNAMIVEVTDADELFNVIVDAQDGHIDAQDEKGKVHKVKFDTLVIDSLTEAQRLIKDRILKQANREDMILKDWNTLTNHMQRMIRAIRDLPVNVICTALMEESYEESSGTRYIKPQFDGKKTTQQISQYFNMVGYLFKKDGGKATSDELQPRYLMLDGPNNVMCKPAHPVVGTIENPNISQILSDIQSFGKKPESKQADVKSLNTQSRRRMRK